MDSDIKDNPSNQNTIRTVKQFKGEKQIIDTIQNNKHKDLLLKNENVLKCFVYNKLVAETPKLKHSKKNHK